MTSAILTVRGLERSGLTSVDFDLALAECLAVQGASGSGKTLLLRALADMDPNRGEVVLDGTFRSNLSGPEWRRRVVYAPAESGWWDERVASHFGDWAEAMPFLEAMGLPPAIRNWAITRLSTGERQRLALARALTVEPRVLLLDEPTSALYERATQAVEGLVRRCIGRGLGVLWVTHDSAQAKRMAERRLWVQDGGVREERL